MYTGSGASLGVGTHRGGTLPLRKRAEPGSPGFFQNPGGWRTRPAPPGFGLWEPSRWVGLGNSPHTRAHYSSLRGGLVVPRAFLPRSRCIFSWILVCIALFSAAGPFTGPWAHGMCLCWHLSFALFLFTVVLCHVTFPASWLDERCHVAVAWFRRETKVEQENFKFSVRIEGILFEIAIMSEVSLH